MLDKTITFPNRRACGKSISFGNSSSHQQFVPVRALPCEELMGHGPSQGHRYGTTKAVLHRDGHQTLPPCLCPRWQFADRVYEFVLHGFSQASSNPPYLFIHLFLYFGFLTPTVPTALPRSGLGSLPCSTLCQPMCFVAVQRGPEFTLALKIPDKRKDGGY